MTGPGVPLPVQRLDPDLPVPMRAHADDAGLDLMARVAVSLRPGERAVVPTGIAVAIPAGYVGLVCARSGLAARSGLGLVNGPGVIDAGYRGEIAVVLVNHDPAVTVEISRADRIAQLLVVPILVVTPVVVDALDDTVRGASGFGSTGTVGT